MAGSYLIVEEEKRFVVYFHGNKLGDYPTRDAALAATKRFVASAKRRRKK